MYLDYIQRLPGSFASTAALLGRDLLKRKSISRGIDLGKVTGVVADIRGIGAITDTDPTSLLQASHSSRRVPGCSEREWLELYTDTSARIRFSMPDTPAHVRMAIRAPIECFSIQINDAWLHVVSLCPIPFNHTYVGRRLFTEVFGASSISTTCCKSFTTSEMCHMKQVTPQDIYLRHCVIESLGNVHGCKRLLTSA